jgi:hypothetical protein
VPVPVRSAVAGAIQAQADALAAMIRRTPWDWHAMQPIWPTDRAVATDGRVAG